MNRTESSPNTSWNEQFMAVPFSKIASNEWYGTETDDDVAHRQSAKQAFIADSALESPAIHYPKLRNEHVFDATERSYQALLDDASTDVEYTKAARRLAELYRHKEVMRGLGRTGVKAVLSHERAAMMSAEIFGEVDRDAYLGLVAKLRLQATELRDEMPEANDLLNMLGDAAPERKIQSAELEQEALAVLREDIIELFPGIDEVMTVDTDQEEISARETLAQIEGALAFFGLSEKGWKAELVPGSSKAASTDANTKIISIGELRAKLPPKQVIKTTFHEVLGHAFRAEGDVSKASLSFEEGFAVALEQIMTGEVRSGSGEQYYTALGLQYGLDQDGQQRGHRETYEIMWRRNMVNARANGQSLTEDKAKDQAYTQVYRTRRGNAIDTRDRSYFEGARVVPEWLNDVAALPKAERQATLKWVLSGRFDPTNEQHAAEYPRP